MKRALVILLSFCALTTKAQIVRDSAIIQVKSHIPDSLPGRNIFARHINWVQGTVLAPFLDNSNEDIPNDTTYMIKPGEKLRIGTAFNLTGARMTLNGVVGDEPFTMPLNAQAKTSVSLNLCYRGLSIGFSFSPLHLGGKNHDTEFSLSAYSDRFGGDILYHSAETYSGKFKLKNDDGSTIEVPRGSIRQNIYGLNGYFAFRWKRFALPAVFDQSWIQRRSAGSGLLGGTMMLVDIKKLVSAEDPNQLKFRLFFPAIGGGYGYNWVCAHHWLIHFDMLLELVPYVFGRTTIGTERQRFPYTTPPVMAVGRFGVQHYFHRCFAGLKMMYNQITIGQTDELQLITNEWYLSLFFGVRI